MSAVQKFVFSNDDPVTNGHGRKHHRRGNSKGSTGSDQSLTYSASSSVLSHSTAGESTDSSFAEIYKVIEDEKLSSILGGEHLKDLKDLHDLPKTITGQQSNSHGHDGGGTAIFEQANPEAPRRRRDSSNTGSRTLKDKKSRDSKSISSSSPDNKIKNSNSSRNSTPPPPRMPIQKNDGKELWYSQFWMCGFADSLSFSGNGD